MKILLITCFILFNTSLFSIEIINSCGILFSGFKYTSSEKIDKSDLNGFAFQTVLPKFLITEEKTQLGISMELAEILFFPEALSFNATFLTTRLHWFVYTSTILEQEASYKYGLFTNIKWTPFGDKPIEQYIGLSISQVYYFESKLLENIEIGYSLWDNKLYITANRDFFLTLIYMFTSAP